MTNLKEVTVPDIGHFSGVEVIEIAIKPGMQIQAEETLITLETEKASMDVPSPVSGLIKELKVKVGDKVSQGDLIALIETTEGAAAAPVEKPTEKPAEKVPEKSAEQPIPKPVEKAPVIQETKAPSPSKVKDNSATVHAGPATRKLARELGVDLSQVSGTGTKNRITTPDVHQYVKSILQNGEKGSFSLGIEKAPEVDFSQFGDIEVKPLSRIKKWTGKNLHRNWISIPHITQFDEADITELEVFRQENKKAAEDLGIKLTPLAFIIKAVVSGLKTFPQFNASLASNGADLILKKYYHIGIAVDTPNGLMVPVVKNVDTKGLFDLAREIGELSKQARDGKIKQDQMQGSCFTISSLGSIGGTAFTPIINAPDVAILGVSKASIKPVYKKQEFVPRSILPLSLSYDHRVIDGVEGAKFTSHIAEQLQDIRKLLL